ncbi:two-partner secretion domain-containing protein [Leptothoe spongobia]|uniref:Filamentous hemagglutinin N-terminal domain-containing protein n=1 Tax=Leptothoe spongobia TAU-MAC 1115 TaxID=1967444 RepID=A0A947GI60_9CYAN|nr:filamentous hemagglutinin N-terminal domain-containing protein [Leptothoe spongobia]MBT9314562.1 filamentous hemagglutinin N-terminal domain-containing protein [Leptothoe spongobia TAU-MAC 1115]
MGWFHSSNCLPVRGLLISSSLVGLTSGLASGALATEKILIAQIIPDSTLGNESSVLIPGIDVRGTPADLLEGGATRNSNLFHSFSDFNVDEGQRVYFANPVGILDIYSRITGSTPSSILGTLGVDGGASLFLINPNGIIFGLESQLDVTGSFTASTAESLIFSDGSSFSSVNPDAAPLLLINLTPGLQYGNNASAAINNQGNLAVGQNLTLGAPLLSLSGSLTAGQDIILQGASRQLSNADYTVGGYLFTQALDGTGVEIVIPHSQVIIADGDVQLAANYNGPSLHILAGGQVTQAPGVETITVTGETGGDVSGTLSDGDGGRQFVTISATEQPTVDIRSGVDWFTLIGGLPGNINASNLAVIFSEATAPSIALDVVTNPGGAIVLQSPEDIAVRLLDTSVTVISVNEDAVGKDGGPITLQAGRDISLTPVDESFNNNLEFLSRIESEGGDESIDNNLESLSRTESEGGNVVGGNGGAITLTAGRDILNASSETSSVSFSVSSSTISGDVKGGNGGTISLSAGRNISNSNSFSLSDSDSDSVNASTTSGNVEGGNGGTITLSAGRDISNSNSDSSSNSNSDSNSNSYYIYDNFFTISGDVVGGNGGTITLSAGRNISDSDSESLSVSDSNSDYSSSFLFFLPSSSSSTISGNVVGGNGGTIALSAGQNISGTSSEADSRSFSFSDSGAESLSSSTISGDVVGGNGGTISLSAGQNISAFSESESYSFSYTNFNISLNSRFTSFSTVTGDVTGGDGGAISLSAGQDISGSSDSNSFAYSFSYSFSAPTASPTISGNVTGGNGGAISLSADRDISRSFSDSQSFSRSFSDSISSPTISGEVNGGNGGITFLRANRDITINRLSSFSLAESDSDNPELVSTGGGGKVTLIAESGGILGEVSDNIFTPDQETQANIFTFSVVENGMANTGGSVSLQANSIIRDLNILTTSSSAQSGDITLTGSGNLLIEGVDIATSQTVEIDNPSIRSNPDEKIIIPVGGIGQPGDISIESNQADNQDLIFTDSRILSTTNSLNQAGIINITSSGQLTFTNESEIRSESQSKAAAGSIRLRAPTILIDQESALSTSTTASGVAGNINIDTDTLTLVNGGEILSGTSGPGAGGNVIIQATEAVNLGEGVQNFEPIISVETSGAGTPGNIVINTPQFTLSETAQLTATATDTATNSEGGGSITLSANTMDLAGIVGIFAETQSQTPGGTLTLEPYRPNPDQSVTDPNLTVIFEPGAKISASTSSDGPGGNIEIEAPESITLMGPGELTVETTGAGPAGTISFNTQNLIIQNGLTVSAATEGGPGGNITINGTDTVLIDNSTITSEVLESGENKGGTIEVVTANLDLTNGTEIRTATAGSGNAGDIFLVVEDTFKAQDSSLLTNAETTAGGAITVNASNVRLFGDSNIFSFVESGVDGGGTITFNGDTVIALDDSDILAFAADGQGGNITFNTVFFGENYQPAPLGTDPRTLDGNDRVDVNASGTISGEISIPDVSFIENSLSELDDILVDPNTLTAGSCIARTTENEDSFIITGTDGLSQRPDDTAINQFSSGQVQTISSNEESPLLWHPEMPIIEPTDIYQLYNGRIVMSRECSSG